jgi:Serine dehydrogenase proteinase
VAAKSPARVNDQTLILADIATKARMQVAAFLTEILLKHHPKAKASALASLLSEGRWAHDGTVAVHGDILGHMRGDSEGAAAGSDAPTTWVAWA